ncbi:MAG: bifunctional glutamate N-acetyltransferase/amino-acid acetyltransferase ArgJ [Nitrospirae bacterium]|nr:bifunctional glutamate N-acetyltransferase/amino-acid acetyltransferase ArgJ [Nitrospirota bacterium]
MKETELGYTENGTNNYELPKGFQVSTVEAAIKKPGRKDLAVIFSTVPASCAGVFTTNIVKAAPVVLDIERVKTGRGQAIVVNSGNANACTGERGMEDSRALSRAASGVLNIDDSLVYVCSTGVIGAPLPIDRMLPKVREACENIGKSTLLDAARAIMTTDTFPKVVSTTINLPGFTGRLCAIAKGAGMICPNMATLLSFVLTDLSVKPAALQKALQDASQVTFNRVTVDGDMSTNDTLLVLANGTAANLPIEEGTPEYDAFASTLRETLLTLAKMIAKDGEGATKMVTIAVKGANSTEEAIRAARSVANSPLVKTAIYGNDANWGRIMASLGYSGIVFDPYMVDISFGGVLAVENGLSAGKDAESKAELGGKDVTITIDLKTGNARAQVYTCDLTQEYIKINAEYRT